MALAPPTSATPWFPNSNLSKDPCVPSPPARSTGMLFRRVPRDADQFEMQPTSADAPFDALELQDDSFVNFSVGNLDRRNFSLSLRSPRFTRDSVSDATFATTSTDRSSRWKLPLRRRSTRSKDKVSSMIRCFY